MSKDNLNSGSASSEATASPKEVDALKEQVASLEAEKEELLALNAELQGSTGEIIQGTEESFISDYEGW